LVIYVLVDRPGQRSRYCHSLWPGEYGHWIPVHEIFCSRSGRPWGPL